MNLLINGRVLLLGLTLSAFGCSPSVGPIQDKAEFEHTLRGSVDVGVEPIQQYGRVVWWVGEDAFPGDHYTEFEQGVAVLQDTRIRFFTWNEKTQRYDSRYEIAYADARDVRRRVWGASQRIVIETNDGQTNAFNFTANSGGMGHNRPATNGALAFLRSKIPSSDEEKDLR